MKTILLTLMIFSTAHASSLSKVEALLGKSCFEGKNEDCAERLSKLTGKLKPQERYEFLSRTRLETMRALEEIMPKAATQLFYNDQWYSHAKEADIISANALPVREQVYKNYRRPHNVVKDSFQLIEKVAKCMKINLKEDTVMDDLYQKCRMQTVLGDNVKKKDLDPKKFKMLAHTMRETGIYLQFWAQTHGTSTALLRPSYPEDYDAKVTPDNLNDKAAWMLRHFRDIIRLYFPYIEEFTEWSKYPKQSDAQKFRNWKKGSFPQITEGNFYGIESIYLDFYRTTEALDMSGKYVFMMAEGLCSKLDRKECFYNMVDDAIYRAGKISSLLKVDHHLHHFIFQEIRDNNELCLLQDDMDALIPFIDPFIKEGK